MFLLKNKSKKKNHFLLIEAVLWLDMFKHALNIPSLPSNIQYFHNHVFTRIFRVIGGLSIIAFLSGSLTHVKPYLFSSDNL